MITLVKVCTRCNEFMDVSQIGGALEHFVCDTCRKDSSDLDYKCSDRHAIPHSIYSMEQQLNSDDTYFDSDNK